MMNNMDEDEVRRLLAQGEKIKAIGFVRQQAGVSLKEAKDYVDNLETLIQRIEHPRPQVRDDRYERDNEEPRDLWSAMRRWSPMKKAMLFLAILLIPFLFMYLMQYLDLFLR